MSNIIQPKRAKTDHFPLIRKETAPKGCSQLPPELFCEVLKFLYPVFDPKRSSLQTMLGKNNVRQIVDLSLIKLEWYAEIIRYLNNDVRNSIIFAFHDRYVPNASFLYSDFPSLVRFKNQGILNFKKIHCDLLQLRPRQSHEALTLKLNQPSYAPSTEELIYYNNFLEELIPPDDTAPLRERLCVAPDLIIHCDLMHQITAKNLAVFAHIFGNIELLTALKQTHPTYETIYTSTVFAVIGRKLPHCTELLNWYKQRPEWSAGLFVGELYPERLIEHSFYIDFSNLRGIYAMAILSKNGIVLNWLLTNFELTDFDRNQVLRSLALLMPDDFNFVMQNNPKLLPIIQGTNFPKFIGKNGNFHLLVTLANKGYFTYHQE